MTPIGSTSSNIRLASVFFDAVTCALPPGGSVPRPAEDGRWRSFSSNDPQADRQAGPSNAFPSHMPPSHKRNLLRASDRKSTHLNSSHANISYAVFCLKKKKK